MCDITPTVVSLFPDRYRRVQAGRHPVPAGRAWATVRGGGLHVPDGRVRGSLIRRPVGDGALRRKRIRLDRRRVPAVGTN